MNSSKENRETHYNSNLSVGRSLVEFVVTLVKYRWFLFLFIFSISLGATVYALLAPKWYKASTSVLTADQADILGALGGLSSLVKNFSPTKGLAALAGPSDFDRYIAILKSGKVIDDVIMKFNIRKDYDMNKAYYENVVKAFVSNINLEVQDEGNLVLSIYDKDPKKASDIANYMILKLNEINTELSVTNARANREFVEKRYIDNIQEIHRLESEMQTFQEKYGVIAVPEQLEATVKALSEYYSVLYQKEVALSVLKRNYGEDSPFVRQAELEVDELRKQLNNIIAGKEGITSGVNLLIPFKKAPNLTNQFLKIFRDLEIQYKILEFIQPLYEQAKVEEVRNTPSVLVLDKASPPERKSKPKGSLYLIISFLSSSFLGILIVFTLDGLNKIKSKYPNDYNFIIRSFKFGNKKDYKDL
jgi:tyrosine-protein kinase Etk/Wzc